MNSCKHRGVSQHKDGGFVAYYKSKYLGYFTSFGAAVSARIAAEVACHGAPVVRRAIEVDGSVAKIPLHGFGMTFHGFAVIDVDDLPLVESISWTLDPRGYVVGRPAGAKRSVTLHRLIVFGDSPSPLHVDHIDGDTKNNTRSNLRECTPSGNAKNTLIGKNNTIGFKGVSRVSGKGLPWRARITVDRKEVSLGWFSSAEDAARAYDLAAKKYHGEFASPNNYCLPA